MWTTTLVLTFLFFLIQLGTGFSILAIASTRFVEICQLTKAQFVTLGLTIGASATGILFGLLSVLVSNIWLHLAIIVALSCFGLAWSWPNWRPVVGDIRTAAIWCMLSLPIALITWWWTFGAFSNFPYADIGADVHWMKTAQEYADSGILNPYAAQSYVDLRSALSGALAGTLGLDLLRFSWTYRFFSVLFFLLASYAFVQGIYSTSSRRWIAFFFAATGNTVALMTNGSLAVAGSVVFLGVLMDNSNRNANGPSARFVLLLIVGTIATLLLAFAVNNNTLMLALLVALLLLLRIMSGTTEYAAPLLLGCIWPATLLLAHRGSYLFVPTVLVSWLLYLAIVRMISAWPAPGIAVLRFLSFGLPLIIAAIVLCVAGTRFGYIPSLSTNETFSSITELVLGRRIQVGDELSLGSGPQIATIELGRAIGPLFSICITLGIAWWWMTRPARRDRSGAIERQAEGFPILVWSWIAGCGLSVAILSGFPFLYRTGAILVSLFTIAATETFCQLLVDSAPSSRYRRTLVAAAVALLATILVVAIYGFAWRPDLPFAQYQGFLRPTEIAGVGLLVMLALLTLSRSRPIYICSLVGVVGLGVAVDKAGLSGILKNYSYGAPPDRAAVVSHYNANDLEVAHWLRTNLKKGILLSDPYTLGIVQALTGAPAAYLFSNLDTVNAILAQRAKSILRAILEPAGEGQGVANACRLAMSLIGPINADAFFQIYRIEPYRGFLRTIRGGPTTAPELPPPSFDTLQNIPEPKDDDWNVVAIITPRTIEWTRLANDRRLNYFPPTEPIEPALAEALRASRFRVLFANKQAIVVRTPCSRELK